MFFSSLKSDHLIEQRIMDRQTGTQIQRTRSKSNEHPMAQRSPQRKNNNTITAAFQGGGFSPFPPGSNCLFSSLGVLSLGLRLASRKMMFDEFAGMVAVPARVSTRSVGEEGPPP